jgi:hypothetical protein
MKDGYYWSAAETEYASDLLFDHLKRLAELYPQFLHHGLSSFQCSDVLRFLGKNRPEVFCGELTGTSNTAPKGSGSNTPSTATYHRDHRGLRAMISLRF